METDLEVIKLFPWSTDQKEQIWKQTSRLYNYFHGQLNSKHKYGNLPRSYKTISMVCWTVGTHMETDLEVIKIISMVNWTVSTNMEADLEVIKLFPWSTEQ